MWDRVCRRKGRVGLAAVVAWLSLAAAASADVEPNNVISQAEGPIGGGAPVQGTLATPDDVDYYVLYVASQQQIHLTYDDLTNGASGGCLNVYMRDTDGRTVSANYTTPPGTTRYFVSVDYDDGWDCTNPVTYRVEVDPGPSVVGGPALDRALSQTGEPNETAGQAIGPLAANVNYVGGTETTNDEDWFWFWVPPGTHQFSVSTTSPFASSCSSSIALRENGGDDYDSSASGNTSSFGHITRTLVGPALMYLTAGAGSDWDCSLGDRWQFRIDTPDAVTLSDPFPPPKPPVVKATRWATGVSLRRRGAKYSGRVTSARPQCASGRKVSLRRKGYGSRSFGSARTRRGGTFTVRRGSRVRGWVYAVVSKRGSATDVCRSGRSIRIRG